MDAPVDYERLIADNRVSSYVNGWTPGDFGFWDLGYEFVDHVIDVQERALLKPTGFVDGATRRELELAERAADSDSMIRSVKASRASYARIRTRWPGERRAKFDACVGEVNVMLPSCRYLAGLSTLPNLIMDRAMDSLWLPLSMDSEPLGELCDLAAEHEIKMGFVLSKTLQYDHLTMRLARHLGAGVCVNHRGLLKHEGITDNRYERMVGEVTKLVKRTHFDHPDSFIFSLHSGRRIRAGRRNHIEGAIVTTATLERGDYKEKISRNQARAAAILKTSPAAILPAVRSVDTPGKVISVRRACHDLGARGYFVLGIPRDDYGDGPFFRPLEEIYERDIRGFYG